MKIGVIASSLRMPLPAALREAAELGMEGIQLSLAPEYLVFSDERLREIRQQCRDYGLEIPAIGGDIAYARFSVTDEWKDRVELSKRIVDIAVKLGTRVIANHIGVIPSDRTDPVYPIMLEALGMVSEYAARNGVAFAIETGPEPAETLRMFLDDIHSTGLGVNFDPGNFKMILNADPVVAVDILGGYIKHTHAKDGRHLSPGSVAAFYRMCNPDGSRRQVRQPAVTCQELPPGQGDVPWEKYITALKKIGYDGFLTIEREGGNDPIRDISEAFAFLKQKLARKSL